MAKDLHLRIGDRILLTTTQSKEKVRAEVVGLFSNEFIIAHLPMTPGLREKFQQGVTVAVRYIYSGKIIGFASSVLRLILKPKPLLFLEFPMMLEKVDLRSEERYDCNIPCIVQTKFERLEMTISDLSRGGCRITCDTTANKECVRADKFELGEVVVLMFAIDNNEGMTLSGKIKNRVRKGNTYVFGISYTKLSSDTYDSLDRYITKRLKRKKR
jgi:c-di-GMP-binding flagellar brake protein YcgR